MHFLSPTHKLFLRSFAIFLILGVGVVASAGPAQPAPGGNASRPINTSATAQTKSGTLSVLGKMGVGTSNPVTKLQVTSGGLCVGSNSGCAAPEVNIGEGVVYADDLYLLNRSGGAAWVGDIFRPTGYTYMVSRSWGSTAFCNNGDFAIILCTSGRDGDCGGTWTRLTCASVY